MDFSTVFYFLGPQMKDASTALHLRSTTMYEDNLVLMKFCIEYKLCFMFIYWLNPCQQFWGILSRYLLSHAYFRSISTFTPIPESVLQALECMLASVAHQHLSNRTRAVGILWCAFFHNTGVNSSPRKYKNGKSTDINSHELCLSAHHK